MSKAIRIIIIVLLSSSFLFAQYSQLKFENFSTIEGLTSSTCVEILQDSEGFLWFGTIDGLNKYDGYNFTSYRSLLNKPHSISNNRINSIIEDSYGHLWIGTSNGLNVFDKKLEKFYRVDLQKNIKNEGNRRVVINDLHFDIAANTLWVATKNGVFKASIQKSAPDSYNQLQFDHFTSNKDTPYSIDNNEVTSVVADNSGQIWLLTKGDHLHKYRLASQDFNRTLIETSTLNELDQLPKSVLIDAQNNFWIGNNLSMLTIWNKSEDVFNKLNIVQEDIPIFDIFEDSKGTIWVATDGFGIYLLDKKGTILQHIQHTSSNPFSLPNNQPSKILEDKDGIFWIASYNKGVSKLVLSKSLFGHHFHEVGNPNSLSTPIAQAVMEDRKGNIWIGTDGGGLNLFNKPNNSYEVFRANSKDNRALSSDKILCLLEGQAGDIWVGTWDRGLNKFDPASKTFKQFRHKSAEPFSIGQNTVWHAVEDQQQRLWLGTQTAGLNLFDPKTERFYQYRHQEDQATSLISNFVFSLYIDSQNRLLVGTALGLCIVELTELDDYIPKELSFEELQEANIQGNRINYITEDKAGYIWLSTDLGLHKLSADLQLITTYTTSNGLPNNLIVGIVEDDSGLLWITTKRGLSSLDPQTGKFKNFNTKDGVQGLEFQSKSITKTADGRILAGGINGFNFFDPAEIIQEQETVKPLLTAFKLFNQPVKPQLPINDRVILQQSIIQTKALELKYDENYITFEFLALHFKNPGQVQYAYRMKGVNEDFIEAESTRTASYSSLQPGCYTFEVKASLDGQWKEAASTIVQVEVLPPPWRTWWAYAIYALVFSGIIWLGLRYYTKLLKEEKERELYQTKLQFFINISHEFRTPLTMILNPLEKILSSYGNPVVVKPAAEVAQRSVRRLLSLVNQLLDLRKMDLGKAPLEVVEGDIVQFCREVFLLFENLAIKKGITFNFGSDSPSLISDFDPDKLEKIVSNLLANAIKFTDTGGTVSLEVFLKTESSKPSFFSMKKVQKELVAISVKDTGIGFRRSQLKNAFNRFFHVDSNIAGTGIGLNFTKSLVELHGGEISVESEYQRGSTFLVKIPRHIEAPVQANEQMESMLLDGYVFDRNAITSAEYEHNIGNTQQTEKIGLEEGQSNALRKKKYPTLLIIEDNQELRIHLKNELSTQFRVLEANDGAEGMELINKHYPDLIISDVMMPKLNGFELCRQVKINLETCHIPVILLTARSLEKDIIEGYNTGADEYLPKPFSIHVLFARIQNLLERKKRLREKFAAIGGIVPSNEITCNSLDEVFLDRATKFIMEHINDNFTLEDLLRELGISRSQFYRKINSLTGQNPSHFIRTIRLKYASKLLLEQQYNIKEVAYMSGFNSRAYFSKTFKEFFDKTPKQFIEEQEDLVS